MMNLFFAVAAAAVANQGVKPSGKYCGKVPFILDNSLTFNGAGTVAIDINIKIAHKEVKCPVEEVSISDSAVTFPNAGVTGDCLGDSLRSQKKNPAKYFLDINSDGTLSFHSDGYPTMKLKPCNSMLRGATMESKLPEDEIVISKALSFAVLDEFCLHDVDTEDHKCIEACAATTFAQVGVHQTDKCPAEFRTIDSQKVVLQCPDGVTNLRYCPNTAINVTVTIMGEDESLRSKDLSKDEERKGALDRTKCPAVVCMLHCENGFLADENGCDTCTCSAVEAEEEENIDPTTAILITPGFGGGGGGGGDDYGGGGGGGCHGADCGGGFNIDGIACDGRVHLGPDGIPIFNGGCH